MTISISISAKAEAKLRQRAAESGRDIAALVSDLIEQAITRPSVDELLAPFRRQVAESGMSDEELDEFHRDLLQKVRQEKKAKSA